MKRLTGMTAVICGLLLVTVPRYVLPACEYEGFARMHCSDTARAELIIGALFILLGSTILVLKSQWAAMIGGCLSLALSIAAYVMPETFGYCHSTKMPCNYGMVPAVRLIAVLSGLIAAAAVVTLIIRDRRKSKT